MSTDSGRALASGTTNWTAAVALTPGTNWVWAYAVGASGNCSQPTNSVSFTYVVTAPLVVNIGGNGKGMVSPNYNGQWLEIGANYALTASAGAGCALLTVLVAVVVQCYQFGQLPFTTIDGAYASSFIFFMGTTLAHLGLLVFILTGLWVRARRGKYDGGHWFQVGIIRFFTAWCAIVTCVLAATVILFA